MSIEAVVGGREPWWVETGDMLSVLPSVPDNAFDCVLTDPPYGLDFMGQAWDHGVPGVPFWKAVLRVSKPGAYMLAFGGTRTFHRLTCAIEDAGWEVRDTVCWLHASGFPKGQGCLKPAWESIILASKPFDPLTESNTILGNLSVLESQLWSLSPAVTASKSSSNTPAGPTGVPSSAHLPAAKLPTLSADLSAQMGTSPFVSAVSTCLNIVSSWRGIWEDACAVMSTSTTGTETRPTTDWKTLKSCLSEITLPSIIRAELQAPGSLLSALSAARYFSAVCLSIASTLELSALGGVTFPGHTLPLGADARERSPAWEPIVLARKPGRKVLPLGIDECRVGTNGGTTRSCTDAPYKPGEDATNAWRTGHEIIPLDSGRWPANVCHDGSDEVLEAFAAFGERPGAVSNGSKTAEGHCGTGTFAIHPRDQKPGPGDTGTAARFFFCAKASREERGKGNRHPTVKPLALMLWLARLICPEGGVILDPFCGSGTTGVAARHLLRRFVGIELNEEYTTIARRRIADAAPLADLAVKATFQEEKHRLPTLFDAQEVPPS